MASGKDVTIGVAGGPSGDRTPRVLGVINRLTDVGGAEGSTAILVEGLQGRGVDFGVVTLHELNVRAQESLEERGARFYPSGDGFRSQVQATRHAIRDFRPD